MRKFVIIYKDTKNIRDNQFFDSEASAENHIWSLSMDSIFEIKEIDIRFIEEGEI
jgi:hypothetical protein